MSTFKKISWNDLQDLKERILKVLEEAQSFKSFFSLCFTLAWLYEYLQGYSKLRLENVEELENASITLKDIRKYTENYSEVLTKFKKFRDSVGHGLLISENEIKKILFAEDFESILSKFDFEENFCKELQKTFNLVAKKPETKSMNAF